MQRALGPYRFDRHRALAVEWTSAFFATAEDRRDCVDPKPRPPFANAAAHPSVTKLDGKLLFMPNFWRMARVCCRLKSDNLRTFFSIIDTIYCSCYININFWRQIWHD